MLSPQQLLRANPKTDRESPQRYALRLLETAHTMWLTSYLDCALTIAMTEGGRSSTKDGEDAANNIAIEIQREKLLVLDLIKVGANPFPRIKFRT